MLVNGALGFLIEWSGVLFVNAPQIRGDRIVASYHIMNPEKLGHVARPDPATATWPPPVDIGQ